MTLRDDTSIDQSASSRHFVEAISQAQTSNAVWKCLEDLAQSRVGHKLFTVMTVDMTAGLARRAYSNHPVAYPVSGTKPIHRDSWFDIVHGERRSFVANSIQEIATVFPDHDVIKSLGCGAVINLPVVLKNDLVATINLLHEEHFYSPTRVAQTELALAVPARLCCALTAMFDSGGQSPA